MPPLLVRHIRLDKGGRPVLRDVSFEVAHSECVVLLGPSGAGKTALLRTIAGFEKPLSGDVIVGGRDLGDVPPRHRNLAIVTQTHRLQPHLDVRRNLAFPMQARGASREETRRRVEEEAAAFSLRRLLRRKPATLSGGEQQAAALARTMVRPPDLVMLDAPLTNIDPIGRARAIRELLNAKSREDITLLVATSDQSVAASVADRVVVLEEGHVRAIGSFRDLYATPPDTVVAQMIGSPPMNLLPGQAEVTGNHVLVRVGDVTVPAEAGDARRVRTGRVSVGIRPEDLEVVPRSDPAGFRLSVDRREHTGANLHLHGTSDRGEVTAVVSGRGEWNYQDEVVVAPRRVHLFDMSGRAVAHLRV